MVRRRLTVWLLLPVLLLDASCIGVGDRARGEQQLAFGLDETGAHVVIAVYECAGQSLTGAAVWTYTKDRSARDRRLWSITATGSATAGSGGGSRRFVVGQTPDGFTQDTPLTADLPTDVSLDGVLQLDGDLGRDFRVPDLRKGMLLVDAAWFKNRRYVTSDEFDQVNAKECPRH